MAGRPGFVGQGVVDVAELRRRPGSVRQVNRELLLDDPGTSAATVEHGHVQVDVVLRSVVDAVVAEGAVTARWVGACRRCLERVDGPVEVSVREVFETTPTPGETWPIDDDRVDLTPMAREVAMLALPLAPLCDDECAGPAPDRFPTGAPVDDERHDEARPGRDPRWAVLDALRVEE